MPPKTAWEWLEGYGALIMKPEDVFGDWDSAIEKTMAALDDQIPESGLDALLKETHDTVALQPGEVRISGSGWGALEELRTGKKLAPQLDFGTIGEEQKFWGSLLNGQDVSNDLPVSYLVSDEWFEILKQAKESWQKHYHLALNYYRRKDLERAEKELAAAGKSDNNRYLLHALANIRRLQNRNLEAAELIWQAGKLDLTDASFLKEVLKMLLGLEAYDKMYDLIVSSDPDVQERPLIKFMKACSLAHSGALEEAEAILLENGGLDIPDIREGENSTSQLYIYIQEERARIAGKPFDPEKVEVPFLLDLRMSGI